MDWLRHNSHQRPTQLALVSDEIRLDWSTVEDRVRRLAGEIVKKGGVSPVVAVYLPRSIDVPMAMWACMASGSVLCLLDPAYPAARLRDLMAMATPTVIVQSSRLPLDEELRGSLLCIDVDQVGAFPAMDWEQLPAYDEHRSAYVMFTSGTTGRPKAIDGHFLPVAHFIEEYVDTLGIEAGDRFALMAGIAHDPVFRDVYAPLRAGAALHVPGPQTWMEPAALAQWFSGQAITRLHLTPALWTLVSQGVSTTGITLNALRSVVFGGDRLQRHHVEAVRSAAPQCRIINGYGATETPQLMGWHEVSATTAPGNIPVGRGIDGVQLWVVDTNGQPCGVDEPGEIWIRSPYLSKGYRDGDDHRFLNDPWQLDPRDRFYRTGDKGRLRDSGDVEFLGRLDEQLKIRGYRIEPEDIRTQIMTHHSVRDAVVLGVPRDGDLTLVAWVVCNDGVAWDRAALRAHLRQALPEYMVPSAWVPIEAIPLTPNGKVKRHALPDWREAEDGREHVAPTTDSERRIHAIWCEVLKRDDISIDDAFFDIGGHSLLATQVVARVRATFGVEITLKSIFEVSTVRGMARYIDAALWVTTTDTSMPDGDMEEIEI